MIKNIFNKLPEPLQFALQWMYVVLCVVCAMFGSITFFCVVIYWVAIFFGCLGAFLVGLDPVEVYNHMKWR